MGLGLFLSILVALLFCQADVCQSGNADRYPDLLNPSLTDIVNGLAGGGFSSKDLVEAYILRIQEVNDALKAVIEINPEARGIAAILDAERDAGKIRGPLHGVPVLVKDIISTNDTMNNTAGSVVLLGTKLPSDSTIVQKLRAAGAIILGKANLSEWAHFRTDKIPDGWSPRGGQTEGTYFPRQNPSGSSSGSAVAAAVGLAFATLGTETDCSILCPSEVNNVVGIKPTVGLTSRHFVIPISQRQDTIGPIAHSVQSAAYLLQAIAGKDPADNYTLAQPFNTPPDYVAACRASALQGARIGVPRIMTTDIHYYSPTIYNAFNQAIKTLEQAGATIVDNTNITVDANSGLKSEDRSSIVIKADFLSDLPTQYLSHLNPNPHNLQNLNDLRTRTYQLPEENYPTYNLGIWDDALSGINNTSPRFWDLYQTNLDISGRQGISGLIQNYTLDALILPTDVSAHIAALLGSPVITVPLGFRPGNESSSHTTPDQFPAPTNNGFGGGGGPGGGQNDDGVARRDTDGDPNDFQVPFGLSFLGDKWTEEKLIGYAYAFEQLTQVRGTVQPYTMPKTQLKDVVGLNKSAKSWSLR